jgi:gamma-glutamylcyclotransferase (GGCT)/AIG2-like uncharacterized protein YtfP
VTRAPLFTYGSLLNEETMRSRAPSARRSGPGVLRDWRLTFRRGVADIALAPGRRVLGGLWLIALQDFDPLDTYEGISVGAYSRYRLPVLTADGERWAWTYVMPADPDAALDPPFGGYLQTVGEGLRQFGHPTDELDRAVREARAEAAVYAGPRRP